MLSNDSWCHRIAISAEQTSWTGKPFFYVTDMRTNFWHLGSETSSGDLCVKNTVYEHVPQEFLF